MARSEELIETLKKVAGCKAECVVIHERDMLMCTNIFRHSGVENQEQLLYIEDELFARSTMTEIYQMVMDYLAAFHNDPVGAGISGDFNEDLERRRLRPV